MGRHGPEARHCRDRLQDRRCQTGGAHEKRSSTDDCGLPSVTCTIEDLADGTYTVMHGDDTYTLTVPVEDDDCSLF